MLRLAADENLNTDIVRGVSRRLPSVDVVRIQEVGLSGADDPAVLAWAAREGRILLTHDVATITRHAYDRMAAGQAMPGVVEIGYPSDLRSTTWSCSPSTVSMASGKGR